MADVGRRPEPPPQASLGDPTPYSIHRPGRPQPTAAGRAATSYPTGANAEDLVVADLNGDGRLDLAVAN